nr:MAG TPA: hypothetical protein [Caudoviricetes sp.]
MSTANTSYGYFSHNNMPVEYITAKIVPYELYILHSITSIP